MERLHFKSNGNFSLPHAHGHESWFRVSRLYHHESLPHARVSATLQIKNQIRFPFSTRLTLKSQPSSLLLINWSSLSSYLPLCSLVSLVSSDFKISLFYFETNQVIYSFTSKIQNLSSFFTPWVLSTSQSRLLSLKSGKKNFPFSSLFFCILCLWYGFIILFKWFLFWYVIRIIWKPTEGILFKWFKT